MDDESTACSRCGADVAAGAQYCGECGLPMREEGASGGKKKSSWVGVVVFLVLFGGCYSLVSSNQGDDRPGDAIARNACRDWSEARGQVGDGVLTDAELRGQLQEIYDSARHSEVDAVADASRDVLAAMTTGTLTDVQRAATAFTEACSRLS
jgi:hypothetical protein